MPSSRPAAVLTEGPRPKHAQLAEALARLATQDLGPDAAIPSERELMAGFGVSRATVRKAIDSLVVDGLLRRIPGKGTFVATPRVESRLHLASFTQDMRRRGFEPSTRLLSVGLERPPADVADALRLDPGDRAWRVDRVRLADDQPIALEDGWYAERPLPGLDRHDLTGSLYALFAEVFGVPVEAAEQTLWAESADAATADRLVAPVHTPLLVFRRVSTSGGHPLEHVVSRYRGDRYRLHMSLGRDGPDPGSTTPEGAPREHS